jgi:hypothetical protein
MHLSVGKEVRCREIEDFWKTPLRGMDREVQAAEEYYSGGTAKRDHEILQDEIRMNAIYADFTAERYNSAVLSLRVFI